MNELFILAVKATTFTNLDVSREHFLDLGANKRLIRGSSE